MKRKILTALAALSLLACMAATQGCYDVDYRIWWLRLRRWIPTYAYGWGHPYYGADGTDMDGIVMNGIMADGVMWMGSRWTRVCWRSRWI